MIIQAKDNVLEKSSNFESKTVGIKNVSKIFKILLDGIYSDPFGSIMREIASNSLDANKESNTDKNVEITFIDKDPLNGDDYTIIFKDYGVGISESRMYDIFCNLGESTKDTDNEQIGGFGIGSKSPFKYTDAYTVKTINNGTEYLYALVLNTDNVPECNLIYSKPSEEESGTEIIIPVKDNYDFARFKEATQKQLCWFKNITYKNVNVVSPEITYEGKRFFILKESWYAYNYGNPSHQQVLLGNIPYDFKGKHFSKHIILKFNIGELNPTASREDLDINTTSSDNYDKVIAEVRKEILEYVQSLIDTKTNLIELLHITRNYNIDISELVFEGYPLSDYMAINIVKYMSRNYRVTQVITNNIRLENCLSNKIYYYTDDINTIDVSNYIRNTRSVIHTLPKDKVGGIYDILLKYLTPISDEVTPVVKGPRKKADRTIIKYTVYKKYHSKDAYSDTVDDFKDKFLKDISKPLVYFLEKEASNLNLVYGYQSFLYNRINYVRLTTGGLNKLGVNPMIIHASNEKQIVEYLLKHNDSFRTDVKECFAPHTYSDLYNDLDMNSCFVKYVKKLNNLEDRTVVKQLHNLGIQFPKEYYNLYPAYNAVYNKLIDMQIEKLQNKKTKKK